jgi:hypothetical protein
MFDIYRLKRMLEGGKSSTTGEAFPPNVVPMSRYLRPGRSYSLTPAPGSKEER